MKKLFVFLLMIFASVLVLTSCQSESSSLEEILALPEFEGFSGMAEEDVKYDSEKFWAWDSDDKSDGITVISREIMTFITKRSGAVSSINLRKYNDDHTEVQALYGWEFSSESLAEKAMNQCPSLKTLSAKNPDVQYLYGNCILIKGTVTKLSLASYPDVEVALLNAGFVAKEPISYDFLTRIPVLRVALDGEAVELYAQNIGFETSIDGELCRVRVLRFNNTQYWEWAKNQLTEYLGEDCERYTYGECVLLPCDMQYAENVAAVVDALKQ